MMWTKERYNGILQKRFEDAYVLLYMAYNRMIEGGLLVRRSSQGRKSTASRRGIDN